MRVSRGESGPVLSLVVGRESREGVFEPANMAFIRGLFLHGAPSSSVSACAARSRLPNGEFLREDMVLVAGIDDERS